MDIVILSGFTFAAWLLHVGFATLYSKLILNTKSLLFRAIHMLEISTVMALTIAAYQAFQDAALSTLAVMIIILTTLAIVDGIVFSTLKQLRERFDIYHFTAAYSAIILVVILLY
jgi:hypothetical protein